MLSARRCGVFLLPFKLPASVQAEVQSLCEGGHGLQACMRLLWQTPNVVNADTFNWVRAMSCETVFNSPCRRALLQLFVPTWPSLQLQIT